MKGRSVKYVDGQTHLMCTDTGETTYVFDSIIQDSHLYHMLWLPTKENSEYRRHVDAPYSISFETQIAAEKETQNKQKNEDFIRAYVALHPDVYGRLEEMEMLNKEALEALVLREDEIHDRHLRADEFLDDRTEALIQQDPDTLKYQADLKVQQDLRAEYSASRININMTILDMIGWTGWQDRCIKRWCSITGST